MKRVWLAIGVMHLFVVGSAQATQVTWTINDATFDDGGTMTGEFTFDESTNLFTDVSITTSLASSFDGSSYTSLTQFGTSNQIGFSSGDQVSAFFSTFHLVFAALLTDAGGTVSLLESVGGTITREGCTAGSPFGGTNCNAFGQVHSERFLVSGFVSAVPEPSTTLLLCLGLAGLAVRHN